MIQMDDTALLGGGMNEDLSLEPVGGTTQTEAGREEERWGEADRKAILGISVSLKVVVGSIRIPISQLMELEPGAVLGLDRKVDDPVELFANGTLIARGKIVVLDEDGTKFGSVGHSYCRGRLVTGARWLRLFWWEAELK